MLRSISLSLLLLCSFILFAQYDSLSVLQTIDTLTYTELEFYEFQDDLAQKDSLYQAYSENSDANMVTYSKVKELQYVSFEERFSETTVSEDELKSMIFAYRISRKYNLDFKSLDKSLKKLTDDSNEKSEQLLKEIQKRVEEGQ